MQNVLIVHSSPNTKTSNSRLIGKQVEEKIRNQYPNANFVYRDLVEVNIPHIDPQTLDALQSREQVGSPFAQLSLGLIQEVKDADIIVITSPMYNWGVPSNLKAWIDHISRPGYMFSYTATGTVGLLTDKKLILVTSAGGVYSQGYLKSMDFLEPYLLQILNIFGIADIQIVRVEGTAIPDLSSQSLANAENEVLSLKI